MMMISNPSTCRVDNKFEENIIRLTHQDNPANWCNRPSLLIKVRYDHSSFKRLSLVECDRRGRL
jgi:hypothetical protein